MAELDSRFVKTEKVPSVASATCQGQILLKPLKDTIAYADIKNDDAYTSKLRGGLSPLFLNAALAETFGRRLIPLLIVGEAIVDAFVSFSASLMA